MDAQDFENLNAKEQEQIFHKCSFKDKAELILRAHDPGSLARSLSQEELYLLTRELDIEERAEVIRHANLAQLFFISDVDCWNKDRLDQKNFVQWLETLLAADERKLLAWLMEMDYEAVVAGFYQLIQVMKPDHEWTPDDVLGDTPYFSLDQMYYIFVSEENFATVRRAIEVLFENHRGRYTAILEGIMGELEDELEEEAYSRREARLAERGFPDFESANRIYKPISLAEFQNFPLKNKRPDPASKDNDRVVPNYMALWSQDRFFLDEVLHSFHEAESLVREGLQEELAWLSNKVIMGDGAGFFCEDKVRQGIERARGLLNIGLELLSGGDFEKARVLLRERWLELLFRWGSTQVLELKERVRGVIRDYWKGSQVDFLRFMDPPYEIIFSGLLRNVPAVYAESHAGPEPLRHFRTLDDLIRTGRFIDQIEKLHELILVRFEKEFEKAKKDCMQDEPGLTFFRFLGTLFGQYMLTKKMVYHPLEASGLEQLLASGFDVKGTQRVLKKQVKEDFLSRLLPSVSGEVYAAPLALFFDRFEDEFSRIQDTSAFDVNYISVLKVSSPETPLKSKFRVKKKH